MAEQIAEVDRDKKTQEDLLQDELDAQLKVKLGLSSLQALDDAE